jgi:hypothetical protein
MSCLTQRILDYCSSNGPNPVNSLRRLLKKSCSSGHLLLDDSVPFQDTEVLNHVLAAFDHIRPGDNKTLRNVTRHLNPVVSSFESALSVLEHVSKAGYKDDSFVALMFAKILNEYSIMSITSVDLARMLRIMQIQRFRHMGLVESISNRILQESDVSRVYDTIRILAELDLLESRHLMNFPSPRSLSHCVDYIWALLLQNHKFDKDFDLAGKVKECLVLAAEMGPDSQHQSSKSMHKLNTIRNILYFLHRDTIYEKLSDPLKSWLSRPTPFNERSSGRLAENNPPCRGIKQISGVLISENVAHSVNTMIGAFRVDIVERDRKIVWEYDGLDRYYRDHNPGTKAAYYIVKSRVLEAMGYKIIQIPYWQWEKMRNGKLKKDYCRTSRFLAISDIRGNISSNGDPRELKSLDILTTRTDLGGYHNENVYNKQQPKQAWVWNKPSLPLRVAI